jgi:hypothetical protein
VCFLPRLALGRGQDDFERVSGGQGYRRRLERRPGGKPANMSVTLY